MPKRMFTFEMDAALFARFKKLAKSEGRSMTWYLSRAIEHLLEKKPGEVWIETVKPRRNLTSSKSKR